MSALFTKQVLLSKNQVKVHVVTKNHQRGIPSIVQQAEVQNETLVLDQKGAVKVAILEGDLNAQNVIDILY